MFPCQWQPEKRHCREPFGPIKQATSTTVCMVSFKGRLLLERPDMKRHLCLQSCINIFAYVRFSRVHWFRPPFFADLWSSTCQSNSSTLCFVIPSWDYSLCCMIELNLCTELCNGCLALPRRRDGEPWVQLGRQRFLTSGASRLDSCIFTAPRFLSRSSQYPLVGQLVSDSYALHPGAETPPSLPP